VTDAVEATCTEEGYTGDVKCTVCGEILVAGEAVPMLEHTPGEPLGVLEATCWSEGYTGDICCTVCNATIEEGEAIPMTEHTPGDPVGAVEPTCTVEGYTGEVMCGICGEVLVPGETIPERGHIAGEPAAEAATCTEEGCTGDVICAVCGEIVHTSEAIPSTGHVFEAGACAVCGWPEPGMYLADQLAFTWDELLANGKVVVEDGRLVKIAKAVSGKLVIGEDVAELAGPYEGLKVKVVVVPATVEEVPEGVFGAAEVILFGVE